jgi:hypothetical protein
VLGRDLDAPDVAPVTLRIDSAELVH